MEIKKEMSKDYILPILNYFNSAETQRDADWERVKLMVKVLEDIVSYPTADTVTHMFQIAAREALGQPALKGGD